MLGKPVVHLGFTLILAQEEVSRDDALTEQEQVTAIDLVIELSRGGTTAARRPPELRPEDFIVEENGRSLAVVGLDRPPSSEPWQFLIFFDHKLSSPASIRWAASALADRALALAELGTVEIVVADPEPRLVLASTRDAVLIDQMLSGVFLESAKGDEILSLREDFLLQRVEEQELSTPTAVNALVEEELRMVTDHQDALLATVVERLPETARRALFLVSDGFDQQPEDFYAGYGEVDDHLAGALEDATLEWARTVAAYGWSVIAMQALEAEKVRTFGAVPTPDERTLAIRTPGIAARLDGSLDPEKAAAHHELGQRLAEQGRLAEAETSLKEALRFYHDHRKYARQRAAVLADLGETLRRLERTDEARQAIREAVELDAERASSHPFIQARLKAPGEPLESLASLSGGRVTTTAEELSETIAGLGRRVRLTFQFQGAPDGQSHQVTVAFRGNDYEVRSPSWVRFGTPPTVTALRARRLLAGELEVGDLEAKCRFVQTARTYSAREGFLEIEVHDPQPEASIAGRLLRLTVGIASEEGPFEIRQETITIEDGSYRLPLEIKNNDAWLSVVVDDPPTGKWGGATTEL
jgi:hypothetical protein